MHANRDTDLTDVTLADRRGGSTVLHTTDHHPFWDRQRGGWVDAADLHPGSQVTGLDNRPVRVPAVTSHTGSKLMNDLTVADIHTYYVIAGTTPVLVHNCGGEVPGHPSVCKCGDVGPTSGSPNFENPEASPGEGWVWRGPKDKGGWFKPETREGLHPDMDHPEPIGPHWDYRAPNNGPFYRMYPDGSVIPKS